MHPAYILLAIPFFFLLMGIEALYSWVKKKDYYRLNDSVTNLVIGIGNQAFNLLFKGMIFAVMVWIQQHYGFFKIPNTWWSFVICLVLFDFLFYWAHRWGHEVNFLWGAHSVHHQSEEYNLSVALRQSWFHNLLAFFIFIPIPLLGFDVLTFGAAAGVHTLYQFWIHTKAIKKMPRWFEYLFNTPSHHRVHHAIDPAYIDKNHGGLLIIFDRMFGTFAEEVEGKEIHYGITTQLKSWNPAWANIHYYVEMFQKATQMKTWKDKFKIIFAKPGWLPDYMGGHQHVQEVDTEKYSKYDTQTNWMFKVYAILQFIGLLWGTIAYMNNYSDLTVFYKVLFFSLIILTMLITGAIFENKKWIMVAEYARLVLAMISLNVFYYTQYINWFNVMIVGSSIAMVVFVAWFTYSWVTTFFKLEEVQSS
jgi:alkylglycerol monooxygenase